MTFRSLHKTMRFNGMAALIATVIVMLTGAMMRTARKSHLPVALNANPVVPSGNITVMFHFHYKNEKSDKDNKTNKQTNFFTIVFH